MSDLFDDLFDYNNDGKIDFIEAGAGMKIIEDIEKKCSNEPDWDNSDICGDDFDADNDGDDDFDDSLNDDFDADDFDCDNREDEDVDLSNSATVNNCYAPPAPELTDSYGYSDERYTAENDNKPEVKSDEEEPEPKVWTMDYYISRRDKSLRNIGTTLLLFAIMLILPAFLIFMGYICYDGKNQVGTFFSVVFYIGAAISAIRLLYMCIPKIKDSILEFFAIVRKFILCGEQSQVKHFKKMRIVKRIAAILTTLGIAAAIAVPLTMDYLDKNSVYSANENLVWNGQYEEALAKLEDFEDENFKDTQALILYCESHIAYSNRKYFTALNCVKEAQFSHQDKARMEQIQNYCDEVQKAYENAENSYKNDLNYSSIYHNQAPGQL